MMDVAIKHKVSRAGLAVGGLIGFIVGFEPIWAGQYLDYLYSRWPMPLGIALLAALAWIVWYGVSQAPLGPLLVRVQMIGKVVGGLLWGSLLGFGLTWIWLSYFVKPPSAGHAGYLPYWPWDGVSWILIHRLLPVLIGMILWAAAVGVFSVALISLFSYRPVHYHETK